MELFYLRKVCEKVCAEPNAHLQHAAGIEKGYISTTQLFN